MNILRKHIEYDRKIITSKQIEEGRDIKIYIRSTTQNDKSGEYKIIRTNKKENMLCGQEDKKYCDNICKDYCISFGRDNYERYIWSCYIKEWDRL